MTPWPWTVSEFASEIKGRGYPIKHGGEYVGWMVGHDDAEMAAKLPQIVLIAKRLLHTIDRLSPNQQALFQPYYIAALRETLRSMMSGEEKDNPAAPIAAAKGE
jgi:hypothetical protein